MADDGWSDVGATTTPPAADGWSDVGTTAPTAKPGSPWWLKAAEFGVPAVVDTGAAALLAPLGPVGALAGAAGGNIASDYILDRLRASAGQPTQDPSLTRSAVTGAAGEALGQFGVPIIGRALKGAARMMTLAPTQAAVEEAGEAGATAASKAINKGVGDVMEAAKPALEQKAATEIGQLANLPLPRASMARDVERTLHAETQRAVTRPVGRLFEEEGKKIGQVLEQVADWDADTTALSGLNGPNSIGGQMQQFNMRLSPKVQKLLDEAVTIGNAGTEKVGRLVGTHRDIMEAIKSATNSDDQYVLGELRDSYRDILTDTQNMPASVRRQLEPLNDSYHTLKNRMGDAWKTLRTENPEQTVTSLFKRDPEGVTDILNEATPEELSRLTDATMRHIQGEGRYPDRAGIIKRFETLADKHPEAMKKLFGTGPFLDKETWADMPRLYDHVEASLRDPVERGIALDGMHLSQLNTTEAQRLADTLAEFRKLPEPEQARIMAQREFIANPPAHGGRIGGMRDFLSGQQHWIQRNMLFSLFGFGMFSRHPAAAVGLGAASWAQGMMAAAIRNHPDMYLRMLRAGASGTAQGAKQYGYYAGKMAMIDLTRYLQEQMYGKQP